jgi:hypothetical protein
MRSRARLGRIDRDASQARPSRRALA